MPLELDLACDLAVASGSAGQGVHISAGKCGNRGTVTEA